MLQGVFQGVPGALHLRPALLLHQPGVDLFQLRVEQIKLIGGAGLLLRVNRVFLLAFRREQGFAGSQRLFRQLIGGQRPVQVANDPGLQGRELGGRQLAPGFGGGDRPLVLVQEGQLDRESQRPLIIPLIKLVTGAEVHVGILFGNFQL